MFAAVLKIYAEAGWSGFSFDAVARSAGVGKAPLYLRWKTREDLLLSALSAHYRSISITDSGNLRDDLVEYAARLLESKASPDGWAFLRIHLEATVVPALHARFSSQIAIPHVEGARALLHRAIASGELPADTAVGLLLDSLYGAIVIRMILSPPGERAQLAAEPRRYAAPIVDFVLSGLVRSGALQQLSPATSPPCEIIKPNGPCLHPMLICVHPRAPAFTRVRPERTPPCPRRT